MQTKPDDSFTRASLRVRKYFIETSFGSPAMNSFTLSSKGGRMVTPKDMSASALQTGCHDPGTRRR